MNTPLMIAACLALAGVAGCGGDDAASDEPGATSATATTAVASSTSLASSTAATTTTTTTKATTTATTTTAATTTTVAACSRPAASAGRTDRTVEIAGLSRHYILYVPADYDGSSTKLVLDLHGSGSSAAEQFDGSKIAAVADAHGFIVVAPDAGVTKTVGDNGPTGGVWNIPGAVYVDGTSVDPNAPDDVAFIDELVTQLRAEFCIDGAAATGTSGGGRMSSALACLSDQLGAVGPVAGLRFPDGCAPTHPVDIVAFHGTDDMVNPYLGGGLASWGPQSVPDAAAAWALLQ